MPDWDEYADYVDGPKAATNPTLPNADELEVAGRDIFECSNQLGGYVGPNTEEELASFLLRESSAAAELAGEIVRLREALSSAQARIERIELTRGAASQLALDAIARAEASEAEVKRLREALEQAQSNEDRLLKAINATDLSSEQKAFIADHLERSRPARTALSGGSSNG